MDRSPPLILLPGLLCDQVVWAQQVAALGSLHQVHVADLRGHDSIEAMAESVLAEAAPRFALAGHSMGGRVALQIMCRAPERVERLALLDTGAHQAAASETPQRQALVDLAHAQGMRALAARWLPPMVHPRRLQDDTLMSSLTAMVERMTPEIFELQIRALLARPDDGPVLSRIVCPTLVGVGRQDTWSPLSQHQAMADKIPGARLVIFEDCGHMSTVEAPDAVTDALRAWLTR
jgi:pimeloyl-ACP methyl ester carboxylesterase